MIICTSFRNPYGFYRSWIIPAADKSQNAKIKEKYIEDKVRSLERNLQQQTEAANFEREFFKAQLKLMQKEQKRERQRLMKRQKQSDELQKKILEAFTRPSTTNPENIPPEDTSENRTANLSLAPEDNAITENQESTQSTSAGLTAASKKFDIGKKKPGDPSTKEKCGIVCQKKKRKKSAAIDSDDASNASDDPSYCPSDSESSEESDLSSDNSQSSENSQSSIAFKSARSNNSSLPDEKKKRSKNDVKRNKKQKHDVRKHKNQKDKVINATLNERKKHFVSERERKEEKSQSQEEEETPSVTAVGDRVYVEELCLLINGDPLDQMQNRNTEDQAVYDYVRMQTTNGFFNHIASNGINYDDFLHGFYICSYDLSTSNDGANSAYSIPAVRQGDFSVKIYFSQPPKLSLHLLMFGESTGLFLYYCGQKRG